MTPGKSELSLLGSTSLRAKTFRGVAGPPGSGTCHAAEAFWLVVSYRSAWRGLLRPGAAVPHLDQWADRPGRGGGVPADRDAVAGRGAGHRVQALNVGRVRRGLDRPEVPFQCSATIVSALPAGGGPGVADGHAVRWPRCRIPSRTPPARSPASGSMACTFDHSLPVHCSASGAWTWTRFALRGADREARSWPGGRTRWPARLNCIRAGLWSGPTRSCRSSARPAPCSRPVRPDRGAVPGGRAGHAAQQAVAAWWPGQTTSCRSSARPRWPHCRVGPPPCSPWPRCRRFRTGRTAAGCLFSGWVVHFAAVPPLGEQPERGLAVGVPGGHAGVRGRARHAGRQRRRPAGPRTAGWAWPAPPTWSRSTARPASGLFFPLRVVTRPVAVHWAFPVQDTPYSRAPVNSVEAAAAPPSSAGRPRPCRLPGRATGRRVASSLLTARLAARRAGASRAGHGGGSRRGQRAPGGDRGERRCFVVSCHSSAGFGPPCIVCAIHQGRSIHPIGWHNASRPGPVPPGGARWRLSYRRVR